MTLPSLQNVKKYRLANGLDVLLEINRAMPVVSINVGVKVGSVWENVRGFELRTEDVIGFFSGKNYRMYRYERERG